MKRNILAAVLAVISLMALTPAASNALTAAIPLKKLLPTDVITLQGAADDSSEFELSLPVPPRWRILQAGLEFPYYNSSALLPEISRLLVEINRRPVAQIGLDSRSPEGLAKIALPADFLQVGYNPLLFSVSQHYTLSECEDSAHPGLWSRIDLTRANFTVTAEPQPVPERVSAIADYLFDPRDFLTEAVHIVVPEMTGTALQWAVEAAAAVALRYEYRPIRFTVSTDLQPGVDNVAVGAPPFLAGLAADNPVSVEGAIIGVRQLPLEKSTVPAAQERSVDSAHALVMISGTTDEEIGRALRAFALQSYPYPDAAQVTIDAVEEPELATRQYRNTLEPEKTYSLASLGFQTTSFQGVYPKPRGFSFRLPSDMYRPPNLPVKLIMNLAYGAGMRADSSLNVMVNDKFVTAVPLDSGKGGSYRGYEVHLLMSALKAGLNQVRFVPVLTPPILEKCAPVQQGNLLVTVFEDSFLTMPASRYWLKMPDLKAVVIDAFPFGVWPDMRETELVVAVADPATFSAAANLVGLAAQRIGYPPSRLAVGIGGARHPDRNTLLLGTWPQLAADPPASAPAIFELLTTGRVPLPQLERPAGIDGPFAGLQGKMTGWLGLLPENLRFDRTRLFGYEQIRQPLGAGRGILAEYRSPGSADRTTLLLTASTGKDLAATAAALWDPAVQGSLHGDLALITLTGDQPTTHVLQVGDRYFLGRLGSLPVVDYLVNTYPWISLAVGLGILFFLALVIFLMLRKRRQRLGHEV